MSKWFKKMFHRHKYSTLLIYPPHNTNCDQPSCSQNNKYGFLMMCECGYRKTTGLPYSIINIFCVENTKGRMNDD